MSVSLISALKLQHTHTHTHTKIYSTEDYVQRWQSNSNMVLTTSLTHTSNSHTLTHSPTSHTHNLTLTHNLLSLPPSLLSVSPQLLDAHHSVTRKHHDGFLYSNHRCIARNGNRRPRPCQLIGTARRLGRQTPPTLKKNPKKQKDQDGCLDDALSIMKNHISSIPDLEEDQLTSPSSRGLSR